MRQIFTSKAFHDINILNLYNRPATLIALFIWPLIARAAQVHILSGILLWFLAFGIIMSFISSSAVLAIVLGGTGFVLVVLAPRIGGIVIATLIAVSILAAPALPPSMKQAAQLHESYTVLPRSGYHRLLIWRFVADRIEERPLTGWGFDTSRDIPGKKRRLDESEQALPLHPHNAALQWWLELGVIGAILGSALILWLMRAIGGTRASILGKASAAGLVLSAVTVSFLSYGIWQSWWIATLWLVGAFMAALMRTENSKTGPEPT
jgi:O-antigen ligase